MTDWIPQDFSLPLHKSETGAAEVEEDGWM